MENSKPYLSFQVGAQWYGIPIENVMEVSYLMALNELPVIEKGVLGLMTIRETAIPVIDLRFRFGIMEPQFKINTPVISIQTGHGLVGLIVDDVDNVLNLSAEQPPGYEIASVQCLKGVARLNERMLLLLDADLL